MEGVGLWSIDFYVINIKNVGPVTKFLMQKKEKKKKRIKEREYFKLNWITSLKWCCPQQL